MVSKKKIETVKQVTDMVKSHAVVGILDMHALPARQLYNIRSKLKGEATIKMVKKRLINIILKNTGFKEIENLTQYIKGEPALLLSNQNPFKLARKIEQSKSSAFAKPGDIAPRDIVVKAGPTPLPPGPAIGDFQKLKIPAGVEGNKIAVKQDTVVAKEGDEISPQLAAMLSKLGIEPMEIGLNLLAVWENGTIYDKDLLFIPQEKYIEDLKQAYSNAFNLAFNIGYYTKDNITLFLQKAQREAIALALDREIPTKETVGPLLAKAKAQMEALKKKAKIEESAENPSGGEQEQESKSEEESSEETKEKE